MRALESAFEQRRPVCLGLTGFETRGTPGGLRPGVLLFAGEAAEQRGCSMLASAGGLTTSYAPSDPPRLRAESHYTHRAGSAAQTVRDSDGSSVDAASRAGPGVPGGEVDDAVADVDRGDDVVVEPREELRHGPVDAGKVVGLADEKATAAMDAVDELADRPLARRRPRPESLEQAFAALEVVLRFGFRAASTIAR